VFARSWLRAAFGAGGIVALMPLGLVLSLAVAAAVGGAGLDGLGQLFGGPRVPGLEPGTPGAVRVAGADGGGDVPAIPARAGPRTAPSGLRPAARSFSPAPRPEGEDGAGPAGARPPKAAPPAPRPVTPPTAPTAPPSAAPPPAAPPPGAPTPVRDPVRELTRTVQETLRPVLPPVGPTAADAVGTVVELLAPPP
jgi:hypothetical protein